MTIPIISQNDSHIIKILMELVINTNSFYKIKMGENTIRNTIISCIIVYICKIRDSEYDNFKLHRQNYLLVLIRSYSKFLFKNNYIMKLFIDLLVDLQVRSVAFNSLVMIF